MLYPVTPTLSVLAFHDRLVLVDVVPDAARFDGADGDCVSPPPPLVETENEFTARPVWPIHGSKPAWMLVRYHERLAKPRLTASSKKVRTLKLIEVADGTRR